MTRMTPHMQIIASVGIGLSMNPPLVCMQAAMPLKEVATVTTAFVIGRPLGASIGA